MIAALRRRYRAWEWTALNCPHRKHLRRYRWPLTAYSLIRIRPAYIAHTIRNRNRT